MIKKLYFFFEKILEYGISFMCFCLPLAYYMKTYDSCQIKITIVQVFGVFFITIWILKNFMNIYLLYKDYEISQLYKDNILKLKDFFSKYYFVRYKNFLFIPILLFLISGIISYFFSPFESTSLDELSKRIIYILMCFIIASEYISLKKLQRLLFVIFLATLICAFYGFIQFLGLDYISWKGAFGNRVFSTFGNPNFFSAFLVWTTPIIISYIMLTRKWIYSIIVILELLGIFSSQSKASWIGISFAIIAFAFISVNYFSHLKQNIIKKVMLIMVIFFIIFSSLGVWYFTTKRIDSIRFRLFTWEATWNMITKPTFVSPIKSQILGTGIGTFKIVYPAYRSSEIFYIEGKHNTATEHPENEFLEVLYDEGIVGFGIFLWLIFLFMYFSLYKISYISKTIGAIQRKNMTVSQKNDIILQHYLVGILCGFFGLCIHNLMCVNMRFVSSGFFFWIILGLILAIIQIYENKENFYELELYLRKINFYDGLKAKIKKNEKIKLKLKKSLNIVMFLVGIILIILAIFFIKKSIGFFEADIHHNRGIFYSKNAMYNEAMKEYQMVTKLNPNFVMSYYFIGNILIDNWDMQKKYKPEWGDKPNIYRTDAQRALEMYDKVKSIAPNYVQTHFQVGTIYLKLKEYDKAVENFEKYLKLDPVFIYTYLHIASIYLEQGFFDKAVEIYKQALKYNSTSSLLYFQMGNMWYNAGDMEQAKENYIKAIEFDKENIQSYKNLIYIYWQEGNQEKVMEWSKKLEQISPEYNLANMLKEGNNAE
ncbi:MAG: tetratricopeptide repeat protein [Elusimicrobiota bacterium]|jgi:tetratricopeptide (TPR) repeat protein/O-antigen ligase|nr:tetratricopeptide repeat protein [Elusimicrobiota bacterium]